MGILSFIADIQARDVMTFASGIGIGSMTSAFITYRLARHAKHADSRIEADRKLYAELVGLLSPTVLDFLKHTGNSFPRDDLKPFDDFVYRWNSAERRFHDSKVEEERAKLHASTEALLEFISFETFDVGNGRNGAPAEWKDANPERHRRVVGEVQELAHQVLAAHQCFVRIARKRLHI